MKYTVIRDTSGLLPLAGSVLFISSNRDNQEHIHSFKEIRVIDSLQ